MYAASYEAALSAITRLNVGNQQIHQGGLNVQGGEGAVCSAAERGGAGTQPEASLVRCKDCMSAVGFGLAHRL